MFIPILKRVDSETRDVHARSVLLPRILFFGSLLLLSILAGYLLGAGTGVSFADSRDRSKSQERARIKDAGVKKQRKPAYYQDSPPSYATDSSYDTTENASGAITTSGATVGDLLPGSKNQRVNLSFINGGEPKLKNIPALGFDQKNALGTIPPTRVAEGRGRMVSLSQNKDHVFYTLDSGLQTFVQQLVEKAKAPHIAIVAMEPKTGRIVAIADKSNSIPHLAFHAGFPAASIFKVVTSAAALERSTISPYAKIPFRGGNYVLERWNFTPDPRRDRKSMAFAEALGKSCNPVFARIALKFLTPTSLTTYAQRFGFNRDLGFQLSLPVSRAQIPEGDPYLLGRAAAGFGEVTLSPVHAVTLMSAIANNGNLPRPSIIDQVVDRDGRLLYRHYPEILSKPISEETADQLLRMMEFTTTVGTSRKEFSGRKNKFGVRVAAKTGTLTGDNPEGLNHWFIAAAPIENPRIAIAVIAVDPVNSSAKASRLGRMIIEKALSKK